MANFDSLTFKEVDIIQSLWNNYSISVKNIAKLYEISERTANKVISGKYIVQVTGTEDDLSTDTDSGGVRDGQQREEFKVPSFLAKTINGLGNPGRRTGQVNQDEPSSLLPSSTSAGKPLEEAKFDQSYTDQVEIPGPHSPPLSETNPYLRKYTLDGTLKDKIWKSVLSSSAVEGIRLKDEGSVPYIPTIEDQL